MTTTNRFMSRNTYTDEWSEQATQDEREAAHIARSLWRQSGLPTNCRPAKLAEIMEEADTASITFDRMQAAYLDAKAAVVAADAQHETAIDEWIKDGAEGKPPSRSAVDAAERELTDAGLRLKSAARNASAHGPGAQDAVDQHREEWKAALAAQIDEARSEAHEALQALRVVVAKEGADAQEKLSRLHTMVRDSEFITGLSGVSIDAPRLADLVVAPLPGAPRV